MLWDVWKPYQWLYQIVPAWTVQYFDKSVKNVYIYSIVLCYDSQTTAITTTTTEIRNHVKKGNSLNTTNCTATKKEQLHTQRSVICWEGEILCVSKCIEIVTRWRRPKCGDAVHFFGHKPFLNAVSQCDCYCYSPTAMHWPPPNILTNKLAGRLVCWWHIYKLVHNREYQTVHTNARWNTPASRNESTTLWITI